MQREPIAEISIDQEGRLRVRPESTEFPFIYREAMEVTWDAASRSLCTPKPREWTYIRWFRQILDAARQSGFELIVDDGTRWTNADSIKIETILMSLASAHAGHMAKVGWSH